jgi:hypothetical protein
VTLDQERAHPVVQEKERRRQADDAAADDQNRDAVGR